MKRTLLTIAASLLLAVSSFAGDLGSFHLSLGKFFANTQANAPAPKVWVNQAKVPIYIRKVCYFLGYCGNGEMDNPVSITRLSDGMMIFYWGNDHYMDGPGGSYNNPSIDFGTHWVTIAPGDGIELISFGVGYQRQGPSNCAPIPFELNYNWTVQ